MNRRPTFLLKLVGFSALFYLAGDLVIIGYNNVLLQLYRIFWPISWPEFVQGYNSALRTIPFIALLLATPGITWKRRLAWLAGGPLVFMLMDMVSTAVWGGPPFRDHLIATTKAHYTWSLIWDTAGHWLLPLLLWLMATHRQVQEMMHNKTESTQAASTVPVNSA